MTAPKQPVPTTTADKKVKFAVLFSPPVLKWVIVLLPLAYLWFRLINNLWPEWTTNPQYGYGLLVPFLCLGLLVRRWQAVRTTGLLTTGLQDYETTGSQDRRAEVRVKPQSSNAASSGPRKTAERPRGEQWSVVCSPWSVVRSQWSVVLLFAFLAFLYLPTRLIVAAVPEWRPIQWSLGIEVIGLTLYVIYVGMGRGWLRQLAFPICFFFVAIPWPSPIENPIIQHLTRASAAIVIELLGWVGVPALAHGNVIEVSTGMVGIDEACSGIRSFQSSLMISLFFGEFYRLSHWRRGLLVPMGFVFSVAFNVCRMSLLTLVAAKKGVAAISQYHDEAGITIAILCTLALWGVAILLRSPKSKVQSPKLEAQESATADHKTMDNGPSVVGGPVVGSPVVGSPSPVVGGPVVRGPSSVVSSQSSVVRGPWSVVSSPSPAVSSPSPVVSGQWSVVRSLALSLLIWLVLVESGVQIWYRTREAHLIPGPAWTLTFPQDNPTLKDLPMDATTRYLLRFDEAKQAAWTEPDGTQWEAFYFSWLPGRVAGYLAKRHTPEICLAATGVKLLSGPKLTMMNINGVELPIRSYEFETENGIIQVFHCRWEAGVGSEAYVEHESARYNLIRAIWAGRGNKGQKVLEFIISGMDDPEQAKQALARELEKLIKVEGSAANQTAESSL
ncbi:MAG: exosortase/archaeosortase family protein [Verrucomicrobiota bacterium]|jgi:exosortase